MSNYPVSPIVASAKTYNKAIRLIQDSWERVFDESLQVHGQSPTERFRSLVGALEEGLKNKLHDPEMLKKDLDLPDDVQTSEIAERLLNDVGNPQRIFDVDELTPRQLLDTMYAVAENFVSEVGTKDIHMTAFLRAVLNEVFAKDKRPGRLNVGRNRHFPRLIQYAREFEHLTDWGDGQGFKIMNVGGGGYVRETPVDPKTLKVRLNRDFL